VKLLDSSPAGNPSRLHTVRWRPSARSKASGSEFVFAELRTRCWNLFYACVRPLGTSVGELGP
jgi:hypothetical protein